MILWLIGAIALSSAFVIYGWTQAAWQHRQPISHWNSALVLALALDAGAIALAAVMGLSAGQLVSGEMPAGVWNPWMTGALAGLLVSKIMLVWVAALVKGRRYTWLWPAYWVAMIGWALFVAFRGE